MGYDPRVGVYAVGSRHGLDVFIKARVGAGMHVEWSVWTDLVVDVFIIYDHLDVSEAVVDLGVEFAVDVDRRIDVVVVMNFGFVEIVEGDSVVEVVFDWKIDLEIVFMICRFSFFTLEFFHVLVDLSSRHSCCR